MNLINSQQIKAKALELGFSGCGIAKVEFLEKESFRLESWLKSGYSGSMNYLENHFDKRLNPALLVEGSKSVISVLYNYYTNAKQVHSDAPQVSMYAYGLDYHSVIKEKLNQLLAFIQQNIGQVNGRAFVDSAPVLEKTWAERSGLGWIGKNGTFLTRNGSFFFIGELIIDLDLDYDSPTKNFCGTCQKCLHACPTKAIVAPQVLDARRCISYLTIEHKGEIPSEFKGKFNNCMFGCDICQKVCPWNSKSKPHNEPAFVPALELLQKTKQQWLELSPKEFSVLFSKSAVKRTKYHGLMRNIKNNEE